MRYLGLGWVMAVLYTAITSNATGTTSTSWRMTSSNTMFAIAAGELDQAVVTSWLGARIDRADS